MCERQAAYLYVTEAAESGRCNSAFDKNSFPYNIHVCMTTVTESGPSVRLYINKLIAAKKPKGCILFLISMQGRITKADVNAAGPKGTAENDGKENYACVV